MSFEANIELPLIAKHGRRFNLIIELFGFSKSGGFQIS
jgi:hypothetical protein